MKRANQVPSLPSFTHDATIAQMVLSDVFVHILLEYVYNFPCKKCVQFPAQFRRNVTDLVRALVINMAN